MSDIVSTKRCKKGKKVAFHEARLTREDERPCYVVGLVDRLSLDQETPQHWKFHFHEKGQTRTEHMRFN